MMYCYSKGPGGDYGFRAVDANYVAQTGEVIFPAQPSPDQLAAAFPDYNSVAQAASIKSQIAALEASVTARMLQEAIAGSANTFTGGAHAGKTAAQALASIRSQIDALRTQL